MLKQIQDVQIVDGAVIGTYVAKWDAKLSYKEALVESGASAYIGVRTYDVSVDDGVARARISTYRAAWIGECRLTGIEHCDLRTDLLIEEAQAEADRADLAGDIEIKWVVL